MSKKRRFLFLISNLLYLSWTFLVLIMASIIIYKIYTHAEDMAISEAKTSVNKDLAYRTWVSSHGGVYVPVDKRTPPNPYLAHIKNRDFRAIGKDFTLMNPAYTLSQMMSDYTKLYGIKTHITSKRLLNPKNKPDDWETMALDKVESSRKQYYELSPINGEEYLRLMNPLVTKKSCLKCHAFQGYRIGDIRGGVSVSIPMKKLYSDAFSNSLFVAFSFFLLWIVGIIIIYLFTKKVYGYIDEKELLYEKYIYTLVDMLEKRDSYTAGHSSRVAKYSKMIAKEMSYSEWECSLVYRAGMLHDIGKVAIPDSVFLKPSRLSEEEYELIKEHVVFSYEILDKISIFDDVKEIVRNHHEHYDGSGYPRGLIGDETPILSQILALADSFDAMTTDRIYKGRKNLLEALEEISRLSGKQFNPDVVKSALIALKGLIIDSHHHQNPNSLLEHARFSYFYKDSLTGLYNESYLRNNIYSIANFKYLSWISLKDFHDYNKNYGWHSGDKLLKEIAQDIKKESNSNDKIYRFYGDNFLILTNNRESLDKILKTLKFKLNDYDLKSVDRFVEIKKNSFVDVKSLEDVLKKIY